MRRSTYEEGKHFFAQICFHFHQAAEKYLKSFVVARDLEFRKIHDLSVLLAICSASDPSFEALHGDCEYLAAFYIDTRYPVHWPTKFSSEETRHAFEAAARIRSFVQAKLGLD